MRLIKTDRIHLLFALYNSREQLPAFGTIGEWCVATEGAFAEIGYPTYCHKSAQVSLFKHAERYGESARHDRAKYHCDLQHDIAKLNRDTDAPSGTNTDPLFPAETNWIFFNQGSADIKGIDLEQLDKVYREYSHIRLAERFMISADGHRCLSGPELFIEEYLIRKGVCHVKEGDTGADGQRLTDYPFDAKYNCKRRNKEVDWVVFAEDRKFFVEYFEGRMDEKYLKKVDEKREICRRNGIELIEIWRSDLTVSRLDKLFKPI